MWSQSVLLIWRGFTVVHMHVHGLTDIMYTASLNCRCQSLSSTEVIHPPSILQRCRKNDAHSSSICQIILPPVIIWHPILQLSSCSDKLDKCPNEGCKGVLHIHGWTTGSTSGTQPRILHDINYMILLLGAIYQCDLDSSHIIYSTDPRILSQINQLWIPFHLLHRSGCTHSFVQSVVNLVQEGLPINAISRHIKHQRDQYIQEIMCKLSSLLGHSCTPSMMENVLAISHPYPSNDIIARCFIITFQQNEHFYTEQMVNLKVDSWISLDHTFKVASNIGYLRSDGKWVTLYSSILIILNKIGQVVGWQFTKTNSMDEVKPLLKSINERIQDAEKGQFTIYIDNCCQNLAKLKAIFGNEINVKLDLFHAVQRVTRVLSKRHILFLPCLNDFKMVFRELHDISSSRSSATPDSKQMLSNLENFVTKWENSEHDGCKILTMKVLDQINALKVHVRRGCLSNIECSGGTNANEALHRTINPHFKHAGRIGLPLAFALLSILFYNYNCKKMPKNSTTATSRSVAVGLESIPQPLHGATFGIMRKDKINIVSGTNVEELAQSIDEGLTYQIDDECIISASKIDNIMKSSICSAAVAESLQKLSKKAPTFSYRMMPFMSEVPSLYFHYVNNATADNESAHDIRLSNVLKGWGVTKEPMVGDGNCCFSAIAFSIKINSNNLTNLQKATLNNNGIDISLDIKTLAAVLRQLVVAEWKQNPLSYEDFLPNADIIQEADKFMTPGFYNSDLADTMILALANILQATIVVFSSIECHPVFCITPRAQNISFPFMVAYTQCGSGHYDGVSIIPDNEEPLKHTSPCRCGKNDKGSKEHCIKIASKYTAVIKCPCLKRNSGCQELCYCKNCNNPLGKKRHSEMPRRKRSKHEWQNYPQTSSFQFAQVKGEDISTGSLTMLEFFVFENIFSFCEEEGIEQTASNIITIYNKILASAQNTDAVCLPLTYKTIEQAKAIIKMHLKLLVTFDVLCKNQFNWNSCKEIDALI